MERIQVLANDTIYRWWTDNQKDSKRQEKLRTAIEDGLDVLNGSKVIVDANKAKLYDAIEVLIESGLITNNSSISIPGIPQSAPEAKISGHDRLAMLRNSTLRSE